MLFGKDREKGIRLNGTHLEIVNIGKGGITEKDVLIHDQYSTDPGIHLMLAKMSAPELPVALGVIRSARSSTYDDQVEEQIRIAKAHAKIRCVDDLLNSGDTFTID